MSAEPTSATIFPRGMLTTSEVAKRLGVSLRTVQLWVEAGILPAARTPGGHRRIPATAVEALALSTGLSERAIDLVNAPPAEPVVERRTYDVLLVEDNADLRVLWEVTLEGLGDALALRVADTGYAALLHIGQRQPDLLVTDLMLPGLDGFEMIRTLRRDPSYAGIRILAITSLGPADVQDRGGLPPTVDLLHKPVSPQQLMERVRRYIDHQGTDPSRS